MKAVPTVGIVLSVVDAKLDMDKNGYSVPRGAAIAVDNATTMTVGGVAAYGAVTLFGLAAGPAIAVGATVGVAAGLVLDALGYRDALENGARNLGGPVISPEDTLTIAMGLLPGRTRHFAFEDLVGFDPVAWQAMQTQTPVQKTALHFYGSDRDEGAISMSRANAKRAQVSDATTFKQQTISELNAPEGPAGLVIVNPSYGTRIGDKKPLHDLYAALGQTLLQRFKGWRVGIITTDGALAKSTKLPFKPNPQSVNHGGLKVMLYQTPTLR
jgi:putative N6-adenine-specific DNA methylase